MTVVRESGILTALNKALYFLQKYPLVFAASFCFIFGVLMLAFDTSAGDGVWELYAREIAKGSHLYADLGLNQQPLFPIFALMAYKASAGYIIVEKIFYSILLFAYIPIIALYFRSLKLKWYKSIIFYLTYFFFATHVVYFRVDDYHILSHIFVLCSLSFSFRYLNDEVNFFKFANFQAIMFTLCFLTRVTEGAAILLSVSVIFLYRLPSFKEFFKGAISALIISGLMLLIVLKLLDETPSAWLNETILRAPAAKGGEGIIGYPVLLLKNSAQFIFSPRLYKFPLSFLAITISLLVAAGIKKWRPSVWKPTRFLIMAGLIISTLMIYYRGDVIIAVTPFVILFCFLFILIMFADMLSKDDKFHYSYGNSVIIIYPISLFIFMSLSSAGVFLASYFAVAIFMAIVPILEKNGDQLLYKNKKMELFFYAICIVSTFRAIIYKIQEPYSWHSYKSNLMFYGYEWTDEYGHGPYLMPKDLKKLITPVCVYTKGRSLLSLPYSFANYYCGKAPWNGFVQTFFDTSTPEHIRQLEIKILKNPPDYIFYQRQLDNLKTHEDVFNQGRPLPQRGLDRLIVNKVKSGSWKVVYSSKLYPPSQWYLIKTRGI